MADLPNEIIWSARDREIPVDSEDLAIFFPEELYYVSAGVLIAIDDDHSFSGKSTAHLSSPFA
jgi:hypothetical protein